MPFPRWCRPSLVASLLTLGALTAPTAGAVAAEREPVILVHGFVGSPDTMTRLKVALEADGHPAYAVRLPGQENVANARAVADAVKKARSEHGAGRVSLVGHSMGGLSTRYYLKFLGGAAEVTDYVSMGTSQHGYQPACSLPPDFGGQMCPTSPFLKKLNGGDETPGTVRYATLFSSLDEARNDRLAGAWCRAEFPGVPHADEPKSPVFVDAVRTILGAKCPAS